MYDDVPTPDPDQVYIDELDAEIDRLRKEAEAAHEARKAAGLPEKRRSRGGHYGRGFRQARIEPH